MFQKIVFLSALILSVSCMVIHQAPIPSRLVLIRLPHELNPSYNFAYEVNDYNSGDIKSQTESRRGDTVLGQYSLLQPDGVRRTVDYRADDLDGFRATVNNNGKPVRNNNVISQQDNANGEDQRQYLESEQQRISSEEENQLIRIENEETAFPKSFIIKSVPNSPEQIISSIVHH